MMSMRKVVKILSVTAILSVICCIFGCGKIPEYTVDDIWIIRAAIPFI